MNRKKEKNIEFYEVGEGRLKSKKKLTSIKKPSNSKSSFKVAGAPKMKFHFDQGHHPSAAAENVIQFVGESANSRSVNPSWPRVSAKPRQLDGSPGNWPSSACSTGIGSRPIASSATQSHSQVRETSVQSFSNQQMEDQHFSDGSDNDQEECWFEMVRALLAVQFPIRSPGPAQAHLLHTLFCLTQHQTTKSFLFSKSKLKLAPRIYYVTYV